jgi:hypothetical protein
VRFLLAVIVTALAIQFLLTALALSATNQLRHPVRVAVALAACLLLGLVLLSE